MKKIIIFSDKNKKSKLIKKYLEKKIKFINPSFNLIIVIGGDGFMLKMLKKNINSKKYFYGINSGNYGFLLNKFSKKKTLKNIKHLKKVTIFPLVMKVLNKENKITKSLAVNEVYILRQTKQTAYLSIKVNSKLLIKKLISDGVILSTPAGSTAYNLSVHGPILNLSSNKLSLSPISPFRPRMWKGKIISDNSRVVIKNLNSKKRPVIAVSDNYEIRNAKKIIINSNKKLKFNLLYEKSSDLNKKIQLEKLKKQK